MSLKDQNINNDPYEYYDDTEIEDFRTGENYSYDEKTPLMGVIGGGIALLATLVLVGLMGAIYHRDKTSITKSHLVMSCLGVVIALVVIGICFMTKSAIARRNEQNHMLLGIALLLAILFFCYFLASSLYIYMYRPFHFGYLIHTKGNSKDWKDTFKNKSFDKAWGLDRRILWWTSFFSLVATIGFLIAAINLWRIQKFRISSGRMVLGMVCFVGLLLCCFALDYCIKARNYQRNAVLVNDSTKLLTALIVIFAIGIVLFLLNSILNLFGIRTFYFIFGALLIIWAFILLCTLGLVLRDMRKRQFKEINRPDQCATVLDSLHEDDIKHQCPNKYLSSKCSKSYLRSHWETDKKPAFVNPQCCQVVNNYLIWPLYIMGCLGLLALACGLVAIASNFFLSDKSEYLSIPNNKMGLYEIVFAALCVLTVIGFCLYWIWRPKDNLIRLNPNNPDVMKNKYSNGIGEAYDSDFKVVDLNKVYNGNIPIESRFEQPDYKSTQNNSIINPSQKRIIMSTSNPILTVDLNESQCPAQVKDCGFRLAFLLINGKLEKNPPNEIQGTQQARQIFFPGDHNLYNHFELLFGSEQQINDFLKTIQISVVDISKPTEFVFWGQQVNLQNLNALGLYSQENPQQFTLKPKGQSYQPNPNEYKYETNTHCYKESTCQSDLKCFNDPNAVECKLVFVINASNSVLKLKIPLKVYDVNGSKVNYDEQTLQSISYYQYNGVTHYLQNVILQNSELEIDVPNPARGQIYVQVGLSDSSNHYMPQTKTYEINANSESPYVTEEVILMTKDGKGCVGSANVQQCFDSKQIKYTNFEVELINEENPEDKKNQKISLASGQNGQTIIASKYTNDAGFASFPNIIYDYYNVIYEGDDTYTPITKDVLINNELNANVRIRMVKQNEMSGLISERVDSLNGDYDLGLNIYSSNDKKCQVTPLNKWCAYALHLNDVQDKQAGYEEIEIQKFTESYYLTFLQKAPSTDNTCAAAQNSQYKYYKNDNTTLRSLKFNFNKIRKLQNQDYQTLYCFTGWGLNSKLVYRKTGTNEVPEANVCKNLYPKNSKYSLEKLIQANAQQNKQQNYTQIFFMELKTQQIILQILFIKNLNLHNNCMINFFRQDQLDILKVDFESIESLLKESNLQSLLYMDSEDFTDPQEISKYKQFEELFIKKNEKGRNY